MQTITVSAKTFEKIISRLDQLGRAVEAISEKLETAPPYGSNEWWEWSEKRADEDIKAGRVTVMHNKKQLQQFLDSLKTS